MPEALASYRKTVLLAAIVAGLALAGLIWLPGLASTALPALVNILAMASLGLLLVAAVAVVLSGLLVVYRDRLHARADADLFDRLNASRSQPALGSLPVTRRVVLPLRAMRRLLGAPALMVGDRVRVRSLREILATLDKEGRLNGLPFMPEMVRFCGRETRVFRSIDKIYDYGGRKDLRRMRDCVSLTLPRCDGAAHDGCQAGCAFLWKAAWLEPVREGLPAASESPAPQEAAVAHTDLMRHARRNVADAYTCQFTELVRASTPMSDRDPRQDLRPLVHGNVALAAWVVALSSRFFNGVQAWRGGVGYLTIRPTAGSTSPRIDLDLRESESVVVRARGEIAATLDRNGRHKGLWFDRDMLKHCGRPQRVLWRVDRIIDDATGKMLRMKSPCLVLDSLVASGEWLRFCPQHDYPFWREAWIERLPEASAAGGGAKDRA